MYNEQGYKGLGVYQKSYRLVLAVYEQTKTFPKEERYGMTAQLQRAAVSIPLNIAEGHGKRRSKAEFIRFLEMSKGSCNEVSVLLELSKDLGYMSEMMYAELNRAYDEIGKMLTGLMKSQG